MEAQVGVECDLLINCCGNANKGWAIANPQADFAASVSVVAHYTHAIRSACTVHVSTIDVYPDTTSIDGTREDVAIDPAALHVYGFHKWMAESYVRRFSERHLVLRVPGLVGPGLRKNPVFDHFTPGRKLFVSGRSVLNFLHTDDLARHAMTLVRAEAHGTFNIGANEEMEIAALAAISGRACEYHDGAEANVQTYRFNVSKVAALVELCDSATAIRRFAESRH